MNERFMEELVSEVKADFEKRREARRTLEQQWNLNMNFLCGNQYCDIAPNGEIEGDESLYYWQNRNVYNHIAPIVETRIAKLSRVRPTMSVRAAGSEEADLKTARISADVLNATCSRVELDGVIAKATLWSETLGTAFYKVCWNGNKGMTLGNVDGEKVCEGDVEVFAVSPYEIFPESLFIGDLSGQKSIIHARAVSVDDVESVYGVRVEGEEVDVFSLSTVKKGGRYSTSKIGSAVAPNSVVVIERYERPTKKFPNGRVVTVAGNKLLSVSTLPYVNGSEGERDFPFVKQDSVSQAGMFFGASVVERIIPLQRAYNAVKNRKHEFLNRISMGVVTVEDGSVDVNELAEDGLQPGKILVYRQGANPPRMMAQDSVPFDFSSEEERLTNEFITVSGVSEISRNSSIPVNVTSGVALQLLIEQDETRLSSTAENVRRAIKQVAKQIIRLFRQFATQTRLMKIAGNNRSSDVFYFNSSDLTSDDVVFDTENELSYSPAQKKNSVLELLSTGLLADGNGNMSQRTKAKILEILGFGSLDNVQDLTALHISRAQAENLEMQKGEVAVEDYDDHNVHIAEHVRFLLSGELNLVKDKELTKQTVVRHINEHKARLMGTPDGETTAAAESEQAAEPAAN
ncbi:MAG: hypothetical protein IJ811_01655 [Clostridia bacterium]|nr:hypothetical protein [Clostridia bacterium]